MSKTWSEIKKPKKWHRDAFTFWVKKGYCSYREVAEHFHVSAKSIQKIASFYDWKEKEKIDREDRKVYIEKKLTGLKKMLDVVNKFYSENTSTEYLFLIGSRPDNAIVKWKWALANDVNRLSFL